MSLFLSSFSSILLIHLLLSTSQAPAAHTSLSNSNSPLGSGSRAGSAGGSTGGEGMMLDEDPFSEQDDDADLGELGWVGGSRGVGAAGSGGSAGATMVAGEKRKRRAV